MKSEKIFLNEHIMRDVSILSVVFGLLSFSIVFINNEMTLLGAFECFLKVILALLTLWSFSTFRWDVTKGLMGGLLFALLYPESFLVLGKLWDGTADFDAYLTMGVQGSLYLSAQTMSFMMTVIIILNHFVIGYNIRGNYGNVVLNQIAIIFKVALYISLIVINVFLEFPFHQLLAAAAEYIADLNIIIMLICVESQLDNFNSIRRELRVEKQKGGKA